MTEVKKSSQLAREAAEILKVRPWIRSKLVDSSGGMCAMGAVMSAAGVEAEAVDESTYDHVLRSKGGTTELREALKRIDVGPEKKWPSLVSFNDSTAGTKDEVVEQLLMRSAELEAEGL